MPKRCTFKCAHPSVALHWFLSISSITLIRKVGHPSRQRIDIRLNRTTLFRGRKQIGPCAGQFFVRLEYYLVDLFVFPARAALSVVAGRDGARAAGACRYVFTPRESADCWFSLYTCSIYIHISLLIWAGQLEVSDENAPFETRLAVFNH